MLQSTWLKDYAFLITVIFIVLATMVGAFLRRRNRDKCLKDFSDNQVTLEQTDGKIIWGTLRVEHTGFELTYAQRKTDVKGHIESSFILYKNEYSSIQAIIRFHDALSKADQKRRIKELEQTYRPNVFRRSKRRTLNLFKTIRDSMMEVVNLLMAQTKKAGPAGAVLGGQKKYVNQMKQELIGSLGTSFEPLFEVHIGHNVILEFLREEQQVELAGVLKEYTADFIEIMDVDYSVKTDESPRKADLVVLRKYGVIRHLGE